LQPQSRERDVPVIHRSYQKPSNARLIQLNANIEQTIAATDAKVVIAFTDRMNRTL